eukprot:gb/GEZN01012798.1/.p2 GENE.gb/GEZN01012798.1/~~gb/GEZN01012798.1/.p2  ORF type:complete len:109 (+),score=12.46 gb/GEZN01012798.1/:22-327(+)
MWRKAPISMLIFVSLLGHIFDLLPLVSAQRDGAEDDENAVVFVPEYNEVDCAALTTKSACRKERSQCVWQRSEATCVKKGHAEVEGRQGMESGDDIAHEEL